MKLITGNQVVSASYINIDTEPVIGYLYKGTIALYVPVEDTGEYTGEYTSLYANKHAVHSCNIQVDNLKGILDAISKTNLENTYFLFDSLQEGFEWFAEHYAEIKEKTV